MYRPREPKESPVYHSEGDHHQSIVVQDARGDYYYYGEEMCAGDHVVGRFRSPRGTMPEDFVKNYFRGAVLGVDMDPVDHHEAYNYAYLSKQQEKLVKQREEVESQSRG